MRPSPQDGDRRQPMDPRLGKVVERDENGDPVRSVGIHQDVTDHSKRKQELEDTSRKLQVFSTQRRRTS
ncbi:hypothetical protein C8039_17490 [Halogeometricum sp. wsp3]|nr:hypothetical protein C8039_17490 [Halogeometricum sp. wsp3]